MRKTVKIVSICCSGLKAKRVSRNTNHVKLLRQAIHNIAANPSWVDIDAIILPGGFFFHAEFLGNLPFAERKAKLEQVPFVREVTLLVGMLHERGSPDVKLVCGIDTAPPSVWERGDEFCVAFDVTGIVGIGRKAFPVHEDSNPYNTKRSIAQYARDYADPSRIISLPCGINALLCACYDLFGVNVWPDVPSPRKTYIRYIYDKDNVLHVTGDTYRALKADCIVKWQQMITQKRPLITLTAIHEFLWPNAELYWQRHGIATASAVLDGALAVAAAHYRDYLPERYESPLAACGVGKHHLTAGLHRTAMLYLPIDALPPLSVGKDSALIRLFKAAI